MHSTQFFVRHHWWLVTLFIELLLLWRIQLNVNWECTRLPQCLKFDFISDLSVPFPSSVYFRLLNNKSVECYTMPLTILYRSLLPCTYVMSLLLWHCICMTMDYVMIRSYSWLKLIIDWCWRNSDILLQCGTDRMRGSCYHSISGNTSNTNTGTQNNFLVYFHH